MASVPQLITGFRKVGLDSKRSRLICSTVRQMVSRLAVVLCTVVNVIETAGEANENKHWTGGGALLNAKVVSQKEKHRRARQESEARKAEGGSTGWLKANPKTHPEVIH